MTCLTHKRTADRPLLTSYTISSANWANKPMSLCLSFTARWRCLPCNAFCCCWKLFAHDKLSPVVLTDWSSGVARICCEEGQRWQLCHGALTMDFRAGCSSCSMTNSFVTNAILIERAVSCWHLHQLISQYTQYLDSWLSDLLQSELKTKLLEVEGGTCPSVPASDATELQ